MLVFGVVFPMVRCCDDAFSRLQWSRLIAAVVLKVNSKTNILVVGDKPGNKIDAVSSSSSGGGVGDGGVVMWSEAQFQSSLKS